MTICEQACEQDNNDGSGDDDPTMEPVAEPVAFFALPVASLEESMGPHQVTINLNPAPTLSPHPQLHSGGHRHGRGRQ